MAFKRLATVVLATLGSASVGVRSADLGPFSILRPLVTIDDHDQQKLDAGKIVLKILPAKGHELAVFVASSIDATAPQLSAAINDVAELKRSPLVPEIARFSDPPTLDDLRSLTLDDVDLDAINACRPDDCGLKLSEREIAELHRVAAETHGAATNAAVTAEFRRVVLHRVNDYLTRGIAGIPVYAADEHQVDLSDALTSLLDHTSFIRSRAPDLSAYLIGYPSAAAPRGMSTSFLYWSKEKYAWKPIISVTHVTVIRPPSPAGPELMVASNEVFATRYTSGAVVLTLLLRGTGVSSSHYLVYVNRTWVDPLHALWRPFVNHHVRGQAAKVFEAARERIEHHSQS